MVFWSLQSSTAEGFAYRLSKDLTGCFGLNVLVADLSGYDAETIVQIPKTKFAISLLSTYREDDSSDNACDFFSWIQERSEPLHNLRYAACGFGNTHYVYYNKVVNDVVQNLDRLKAEALLSVAKADDATSNTEEDFIMWRDGLFAML